MAYKTIREAAIAGLAQVLPLTKREGVEYGGTIEKNPSGKYTFTVVRGTDEAVQIRGGKNSVGAFHTHPGEAPDLAAGTFSNGDILTAFHAANKGAIHHYLGSAVDGSIYEMVLPNPGALAPMLVGYDYEPLDPEEALVVARTVAAMVQDDVFGALVYGLVGLPPVRVKAPKIAEVKL